MEKKTKEKLKTRAFCDISPFSFVGVDRSFRGAYCLHPQGDDHQDHHSDSEDL
jgi:hypothetical protein